MQPNQFQLSQEKAKLVSINPYTEKHGDRDIPAASLKFQMDTGNGMLAMFHSSLRHHLYEKDDTNEQIEGVESLTRLRFGQMIRQIKTGISLKGAEVQIDFGLGGAKSDIYMETVTVDTVNLDLHEGGTVTMHFTVKGRPTGEQIKKLYEIFGNEVTITVTPAAEKQGSLGLPTDVE